MSSSSSPCSKPGTRNLFDEIAKHARSSGWNAPTDAELRELAHLHEAAGALTENRKAYDRNANLALLCDRWGLYEHRIHFDPDVRKSQRKVDHVKGTLVESVFGILFLKEGLRGVPSATRLIEPPGTRDRNH